MFCSVILFAQQEFHVFPLNHKSTKGSPGGNGTKDQPWDLQTALSQTSGCVNGGDIIWLHEGVYNGNYKSLLNSTNSKFITISGYKNTEVILNGNISNSKHYVLEVSGSKVIFKNFEITYLGDFSREKSDNKFKAVTGINHVKGEDCKFQNLIVHNIPGSGIGSWKATGGTIIEDCLIYNNGYQSKRGHGVGIYVQNQSHKTRILRNNIVFNNYYKGIEVWSATSGSKLEFVKNINLLDNIVFNNGTPSGKPWANVIIASGDQESINVAKNIKVKNNVFYHNTDFTNTKNFGYGNSLTLGYTDKALVENVSIIDNVIIGRNNALNLMHMKSAEFKNNTVYSGYVHFATSSLPALELGALHFDNNKYYTRKPASLRVLKYKDFKLTDWRKTYKIDHHSEWKPLKDFEINPVLKITELKTQPNQFNIALLDKSGKDVMIDFNEFDISEGQTYKIYDIENRSVVVASGKVAKNIKLKFSMKLSAFEKPLHNTIAAKSHNNFGVYRVVFEKPERQKGFFKRLFGWLF